MNDLTTLQNTSKALHDIENRFYDIPFENSDFQNTAFVVAAQITPERAYRAIGLRIHAKLRALQENFFGEKKAEIQIGELQEKIADPSTSKWDKMRYEIDIEQILTSRPYTEKLKNDAMREIACLYAHLEKLPEYTREQFEAGELQHFIEQAKRQTNGIVGGEESLVNMIKDMPALEAYKEAVMQLSDNSQLDFLRINMQNQLITKEQQNG